MGSAHARARRRRHGPPPLPARRRRRARVGLRRPAARASPTPCSATASPRRRPSGPTNPILVSIFMQGGMDALSLLAPIGDPLYRKLRPTLGVPAGSGLPFGEDPRLVWHPAARSFAALHAAGKVTTFPGHRLLRAPTCRTSPPATTGRWGPPRTGSPPAGWAAISMWPAARPIRCRACRSTAQMNPTLATTRNPVAAIDRPENFSLWLDGVWGDVFNWTLDSAAALGGAQSAAARSRPGPGRPSGVRGRHRAPGAGAVPRPERQRRLPQPGRLSDLGQLGLSPATRRPGRDDRRRPAPALRGPDHRHAVRHPLRRRRRRSHPGCG